MEALRNYDPLLERSVDPKIFVIDTDAKADWALRKIKAAYDERDRTIACCKQMIAEYEAEIAKAIQRTDDDTSFLTYQLASYFETVPQKVTKTQATFKLPSGKLKKKFSAPELIHDDEQLMAAYPDYVEQKPNLKWGELKKRILIAEDLQTVLDSETGELVQGVTIRMKPEVFSVEV